jgi:hypothetical protein
VLTALVGGGHRWRSYLGAESQSDVAGNRGSVYTLGRARYARMTRSSPAVATQTRRRSESQHILAIVSRRGQVGPVRLSVQVAAPTTVGQMPSRKKQGSQPMKSLLSSLPFLPCQECVLMNLSNVQLTRLRGAYGG